MNAAMLGTSEESAVRRCRSNNTEDMFERTAVMATITSLSGLQHQLQNDGNSR